MANATGSVFDPAATDRGTILSPTARLPLALTGGDGPGYSMLSDLGTFIRGSVKGHIWPGVVEGYVDGPQRISNGLALQEAIDFAAVNGKYFELEPGRYEIDLPGGLLYPLGYSVPAWRGVCGTGGSTIVQFADNTPILTIGDTYTKNSSLIDFEGVNLLYNADQEGNTDANGLRIGSTWRSKISSIEMGMNRATGARPYRSCFMQGNDADEHNFSNIYEHLTFGQAYQNALAIHNFGTGFVMRNLYLVGDGAPNVFSSVGPVLDMFNNYEAQYESVFEQINIEWTQANVLARFAIVRNLTLISTHFEGNQLTGSDPHFVQSLGSQINYHGLAFLNNTMRTADGASGLCSIINDNAGSTTTVTGGYLHFDDNPMGKGILVDLPWQQYRRSPYEATKRPHMVTAAGFQVHDSQSAKGAITNMKLTSAVSGSGYAGLSFPGYAQLTEFGGLPHVKGANGLLLDNATLYGFVEDAYITCPTDIGANRTLTLSKYMSASGDIFDDVDIPKGRMVSILRGDGTAGAGSLIVKNHDGTSLATITTSGTLTRFSYDGSNWVIS